MSEADPRSAPVDPWKNDTRSWVGRAFMAFAVAWVVGSFFMMRPDQFHIMPRPVPTITLPDGTKHRVYQPAEILGADSGWFKPTDIKDQAEYAMFNHGRLMRFCVLCAGVPLGILVLGLAGLASVEFVRRHRGSRIARS